MELSLRPITADDEPFLRRLYADTRSEELADLDWSDAQKQLFLDSQFDAQSRSYANAYPVADFDLIELGGRPVGRLLVDRSPERITIVDISLLDEQRGGGIGSGYLRSILDESTALDRPVRIHVEHLNPARRLYERLGFRMIEDQGIYLLLEWRSDGQT